MDFINYVNKENLVLVVAIYGLGMMLKNTKRIPDYLIPFILLVISTGFSIGLNGVNINAVIQAIIIVAVAVYSNQLLKQGVEAVKIDTKPEE